MAIDPVELAESTINGITALVWVVIGTIVGSILISKYFKYKDKMLLYVGINIILLTSSWWPSAFGYLLALFNVYLIDPIYAFLLQGPQAMNVLIWLYAFTGALYKEKQKLITSLYAVYTVILETLLIIFIVIDVNGLVIRREGLIDIQYRLPFIIMVSILLSIFVITIILFVRHGLATVNPETRLKAKFALVFILCFTVGAVLDSFIPGDVIPFIARSSLVAGVISLYIVFAMPQWIKNRLIK